MTINQPIGPIPYKAITTTGSIFAASDKGKYSLSNYEVIRRNIDLNNTLIKVDIFTGRAHQVPNELFIIFIDLDSYSYGLGWLSISRRSSLWNWWNSKERNSII
jgi:hypothetical protein